MREIHRTSSSIQWLQKGNSCNIRIKITHFWSTSINLIHLTLFLTLFPSMCSSCSYTPYRISLCLPILGLSVNLISKFIVLSALICKHHSILSSSSPTLAICIYGIHPSRPRSLIVLPSTSLCISLLSQINALLSILFPAFSSIFITNICSDLSNFYFIAQSTKQCIHTS